MSTLGEGDWSTLVGKFLSLGGVFVLYALAELQYVASNEIIVRRTRDPYY